MRAFIQGAENAELHPCDVFSGVTHVEDLFFAVSTFLPKGAVKAGVQFLQSLISFPNGALSS